MSSADRRHAALKHLTCSNQGNSIAKDRKGTWQLRQGYGQEFKDSLGYTAKLILIQTKEQRDRVPLTCAGLWSQPTERWASKLRRRELAGARRCESGSGTRRSAPSNFLKHLGPRPQVHWQR